MTSQEIIDAVSEILWNEGTLPMIVCDDLAEKIYNMLEENEELR